VYNDTNALFLKNTNANLIQMNKIFSAFCIFTLFGFSAQAQITTLEADENTALLHVLVTDMENNIRKQDIIDFEGKNGGKVYRGVSNKEGRFDILLPEGDVYLIKIVGIGTEEEYSSLEIGAEDGIYEGDITIGYEPAKSFTLNDVHFDINKATLRSESFVALDNLVQILKIKSEIRVEIAGHTDNVGDDEANIKLSQARAESVVKYLISKGIDISRLVAKGYGETEPIATNETPEGCQQNRRTEARFLE